MNGTHDSTLHTAPPFDGKSPRATARALLSLGLARIRTRIGLYVARYARRLVDSSDRLSDRFVAHTELVEFLGPEPAALDARFEALVDAVKGADRDYDDAVQAALLQGELVPLAEIAAIFELTAEAELVLLALVAPEVEPGFLRAYTHAWADFTRRQPDVGFITELVALGAEAPIDRNTVYDLLVPDGPLVRAGLVTLCGNAPDLPYTQQRLRLDARLVGYLRGQLTPDRERWGRAAEWIAPSPLAEPIVLPEATLTAFRQAMREATRAFGRGEGTARVLLLGPEGTGRTSLVAAHVAQSGTALVVVDLAQAPLQAETLTALVDDLGREARLARAPLVLRLRDALQDGPGGLGAARLRALGEALDRVRGLIVAIAERPETWWELRYPGTPTVEVPFPTAEAQAVLWQRALPADVPLAAEVQVELLVKRYALSGGSIQRAAQDLASHAALLPTAERRIGSEAIYRAVRRQLSHRLRDLADTVAAAYDWTDLILPNKTLEQLREMVTYFRLRQKVLTEWGFGGKLVYGRGLASLFAGPPGTGKTMSAAVVARELGMELFRVDVSRIVDKYIGETEKNLARVFDEAARAQAVLLFDEADSLFAKRTEVKSSVDRYANLEVNFLLQKMENYDGITILTTNFESGIDDAFKRRIRYKVTFPFPEVEERVRLWKSMIPKDAVLDKNIDFRDLALDFEMAGGHIKNALIRGAVHAASEGDCIKQEHLRKACVVEYKEMGKLVRT